jgi:hypothetical protein
MEFIKPKHYYILEKTPVYVTPKREELTDNPERNHPLLTDEVAPLIQSAQDELEETNSDLEVITVLDSDEEEVEDFPAMNEHDQPP